MTFDPYDDQPWCELCSRPTDHRAEHDDAVGAGLVTYDRERPVVHLVRA